MSDIGPVIESKLKFPEGTKFKMPDGSQIEINDWRIGEYYCSFVVPPRWNAPLEPTASSRSMPIQGGTRTVTRVDCNLPRSGYNGLPSDWEVILFGWRASTALSMMCDQVRAFAANTFCEFVYCDRRIVEATLLDLLTAPSWLREHMEEAISNSKPIAHLRENLNFAVSVMPERPEPVQAFHAWLNKDQNPTAQRIREIAIESRDPATAGGLVDLANSLTFRMEPLFKIHLEGLLRQSIV
jgi:hypothetical protein